MILQLFQSFANSDGSMVFRRRGSRLDLQVENGSLPSLEIVAVPGAREVPQRARIGFPVLPKVGGPTHFELLREWLRACNDKHKCYPNPTQPRPLPKRLLDLGDATNHIVLLYETRDQEEGRYIALSHCWGNPTETEKAKFCTYACNIEERRRGIDFDSLPKTFRDAVTVARELGVRYLWIDSMCIMQSHEDCTNEDCGPKSGDWTTEAKKMEQYFGSAYCTVAADSAEGPNDGLFQPRRDRQCAQVPNPGGPTVYLCEEIDSFDRDVDRGPLNQRGWVFQERALSCRTIHYTNIQTYWECGKGIRCESLAALLPYDRHVAISGVVERLKEFLDSGEIYGIFEKHPLQSLLWRRAGEQRMRRIPKTQGTIPSWSWMAYEGGIKYINIGRDFQDCVSFPSTESSQSGTRLDMELGEPAGQLNWEEVKEDGKELTFDGENPDKDNKTCTKDLKFAIVGRDRRCRTKVYVLIIKPYSAKNTYERVGVGWRRSGFTIDDLLTAIKFVSRMYASPKNRKALTKWGETSFASNFNGTGDFGPPRREFYVRQ